MSEFRYAQFCPLARAAEILGERWTLLILRELGLGPQRFSDLRQRLGSVSSSVLAERLERLEARGLLRRRSLAPPAASTVYELAPAGEATRPALRELTRWGARFLLPQVPGDQFEPSWLRAGLEAFARNTPTPALRFEIRLPDGDRELVFRVEGGARGTRVQDGPGPADASIRAEPFALLGVLNGLIELHVAVTAGELSISGNREAVDSLPELFDLSSSALSQQDGA